MPLTKETKKKISASLKGYFSKNKQWNEGRKWSKAERKKISEAKKASFRRNPELAKKIGRITKERWKNPAFRKLAIRKQNEFWRSHPNVRNKFSKKKREFFRKHPQALKALLEYSQRSRNEYLKTKQGFLVKSRGEQKISNFLKDNSILSLYESIPLMIPEEACIPDFYLPEHNVFIEYYGGHPLAWKKKVKKNKLYKKYKIPCIFITPGELKNLDYYLIDDISKTKADFNIQKWLRKAC